MGTAEVMDVITLLVQSPRGAKMEGRCVLQALILDWRETVRLALGRLQGSVAGDPGQLSLGLRAAGPPVIQPERKEVCHNLKGESGSPGKPEPGGYTRIQEGTHFCFFVFY